MGFQTASLGAAGRTIHGDSSRAIAESERKPAGLTAATFASHLGLMAIIKNELHYAGFIRGLRNGRLAPGSQIGSSKRRLNVLRSGGCRPEKQGCVHPGCD